MTNQKSTQTRMTKTYLIISFLLISLATETKAQKWSIYENNDRFNNDEYSCAVFGSYKTPFAFLDSKDDTKVLVAISVSEKTQSNMQSEARDYIKRCRTDNILEKTNYPCKEHYAAHVSIEYFVGDSSNVEKLEPTPVSSFLFGKIPVFTIPIPAGETPSYIEYRTIYDAPWAHFFSERADGDRVKTEVERDKVYLGDLNHLRSLLKECSIRKKDNLSN